MLTERDLVRIGRALADPTRLRVLRAVAARGDLCCGDIARSLGVQPATVSHHLRVLGEAGLVETERAGQFVYVRAVRARLDAYCRALGTVVPAGRLRRPARPRGRREAAP
jgi:ArsR family transcriptional regulator